MEKIVIDSRRRPTEIHIPDDVLICKIVIKGIENYWMGFDSSNDGCSNTLELKNYSSYELLERK